VVWFVLMHLVGLIVDLINGARGRADEQDLQIALLRHQGRLLQRRSPRPLRLPRWERLTLTALTTRLARLTTRPRTQLSQILLLVQPETMLKWHRELVRRKWRFRRPPARGRPPVATETEALILRLAAENPRWGYGRLQGELIKLGHTLGRSTIRNVLKRRRVPPAPRRGARATNWRQFLAQHGDAVLACDFFTVETLFLKTITVLFFIEIGTRRVHLAGCTPTRPRRGSRSRRATSAGRCRSRAVRSAS
jgi:putative transposase